MYVPEHHFLALQSVLPTARQDFMKNFVWEAYKEAVDDYLKAHPEIKRKDVKTEPGFVIKTGSAFWQAWILEEFFESVRDSEYYQGLREKYKTKFNRAKFNKDKGITYNDEEHREKFEKTLLKNDSVRKGINELVHKLLDQSGPYYKDSFAYLKNIFAQRLDYNNDDLLD